MANEQTAICTHTFIFIEVYKCIPNVHVCTFSSDILLVSCGRMSQWSVAAAVVATKLAGYKCRYKPLTSVIVIVTRSMDSITVLERISMIIKGEDAKGCCLEPLKALKEDPSDSEEGLVDCLIVALPYDPSLRWDEKKTPVFLGKLRHMWFRTHKMLTHVLQSLFCPERLRKATIWGGVYASLFEYKVNVTILKASISLWNKTTHTFLIRTGEMGYSLLDINGIVGLPTYREPYDEHIPPSELVEQDPFLKNLIMVHKSSLRHSQTMHNQKKVMRVHAWVEEFIGLKVFDEMLSCK